MRERSIFAALGALVLSAMAGCGGNVTVDTTGGSGGDGAGGSGGAGGNTSTTSTSSSTSTTTAPPGYCSKVCNAANQYGCLDGGGVAECTQGCNDIFDEYPQCSSQIVGLYDCFVAQLPQSGCNGSEACQAQTDAFSECVGGVSTCGESDCAGSDSDCFCQGECNGVQLEADCKLAPDGAQCVCLVEGKQVGSCNDGELTCDLFGGCCSQFFPN